MNEQRHPVAFRETTPALEFCAWVMVVAAPMLRVANGTPVTSDQAILQYVVAGLSVAAAIVLRLYNWRVPPVSGLAVNGMSEDPQVTSSAEGSLSQRSAPS
jgi:hypothetical protein